MSTLHIHTILFMTHNYLTFAFSHINAEAGTQPWIHIRFGLFTRPFLPSSLTPPTQEGSGNQTSYSVLSLPLLLVVRMTSKCGVSNSYHSSCKMCLVFHQLPFMVAISSFINYHWRDQLSNSISPANYCELVFAGISFVMNFCPHLVMTLGGWESRGITIHHTMHIECLFKS